MVGSLSFTIFAGCSWLRLNLGFGGLCLFTGSRPPSAAPAACTDVPISQPTAPVAAALRALPVPPACAGPWLTPVSAGQHSADVPHAFRTPLCDVPQGWRAWRALRPRAPRSPGARLPGSSCRCRFTTGAARWRPALRGPGNSAGRSPLPSCGLGIDVDATLCAGNKTGSDQPPHWNCCADATSDTMDIVIFTRRMAPAAEAPGRPNRSPQTTRARTLRGVSGSAQVRGRSDADVRACRGRPARALPQLLRSGNRGGPRPALHRRHGAATAVAALAGTYARRPRRPVFGPGARDARGSTPPAEPATGGEQRRPSSTPVPIRSAPGRFHAARRQTHARPLAPDGTDLPGRSSSRRSGACARPCGRGCGGRGTDVQRPNSRGRHRDPAITSTAPRTRASGGAARAACELPLEAFARCAPGSTLALLAEDPLGS